MKWRIRKSARRLTPASAATDLPWKPDAGDEFLVPVMGMLASQDRAARSAIDGLRTDNRLLPSEFSER
jgi:hypothetical protein